MMSSPAALFDVVLDWLAELALGRSEVFVDRIHIDPPSDRPWAWLGEERGVAPNIGGLAAGQDNGDGQAQAVGSQMDLGREATARAAKTFALRA